jgi:hypothetical protein
MDSDRPGVAARTLEAIRSWPPGLPVFGLLTPYPATPLYDRLAAAGRLTRPKHWLEFKPFTMDFTPLGITGDQAEAEVRQAWASSYSPKTIASAMGWLASKSFPDRLIHLLSRLAFRGIYFPQMKRREWVRASFLRTEVPSSACSPRRWNSNSSRGRGALVSRSPTAGRAPVRVPYPTEVSPLTENQPFSIADSIREARQRLALELHAQAEQIQKLNLEVAELQLRHDRTEQEASRQWDEVTRAAEQAVEAAAALEPAVAPDTVLENRLGCGSRLDDLHDSRTGV